MTYYKYNTLADFTTRLPNNIDLTGDWEVGLVEIQYPHNWYNVSAPKRNRSFTVRTRPADDPTGPLIEYVFFISEGYYHSIHVLLNEITRRANESMRLSGNKISIFYNGVTRKVGMSSEQPCTLIVPPHIRTMIGMTRASFDETHMKGDEVVDLDSVDSLYIYCDVVEPRVVGDSQVPLLRIIPVEGIFGELITRIYENVHYVRLQRKNFQTIEINIRDRSGNKVPFEQGTLNVTLHFRQRKRFSSL